MGGNASMAIYPMTGRQVRETAIAGTFSLCRDLGDAMFAACRSHGDPFAAIAGVLDARGQDSRILCQGKIVDVVRRNERGFVLGSAQIQTPAGDRIDLVFQNENLLLQRLDGAGDPQEVLCSVPDLISVVDETTAQPLTTQMLRYGQRIAVLGIRAPEQLRDAAALEVVGPKCFGLSNEYRPITASIETEA